jgi:hypothetical protein
MILVIVSRILFVASFVLIIGYVFGNFSRNRTLTRLTKVGSILALVMYIGMNIFFARFAFRNGARQHAAYGWHCEEKAPNDK